MWILAHMGIEGNELADKFAKQASRREQVDIKIDYGKEEMKSIIKTEAKKSVGKAMG